MINFYEDIIDPHPSQVLLFLTIQNFPSTFKNKVIFNSMVTSPIVQSNLRNQLYKFDRSAI